MQLIAVSKGRSAEEIEPLIAAGQRDFGESRVQEALAKWPALLERYPDVRLHAIGRLQSNKAAEALRLFDVIHALDRHLLLEALVEGSRTRPQRYPSVYIQVNIGEEEQKGGCAIGETGALVDAVRASPLPLAGLMCIPPLGLEPSPYFALLGEACAGAMTSWRSAWACRPITGRGDARRDRGSRRHRVVRGLMLKPARSSSTSTGCCSRASSRATGSSPSC